MVTNLGLLFSFKYYNFFAFSTNELFSTLDIAKQIPAFKVLLPVGISFYTFQTLSYSIDVYHGRQKAETHLGYFALYVSFFPQLVAGPIERFGRLTPQLKARHTLTYNNFVNGARLILFGLFVKMVIADNLSVYVDQIYTDPSIYNSLSVLQGILFYSFQIYADFYGYSTIAIGSALIMGINLMDNFKTPYLAKNIGEFWQRWHISLSTWFRDYLYIPAGGNRVPKSRWFINIMLVFTVSGLWHGANWTFIFWGALYGVVYFAERIFNQIFNLKLDAKPFSVLHIFLALKNFTFVTLIWVFFRSQSVSEAVDIFKALIYNMDIADNFLVNRTTYLMLLLFIIIDITTYNKRIDMWLATLPIVIRWSIYTFLIFAIIAFAGLTNFPFIYFQF